MLVLKMYKKVVFIYEKMDFIVYIIMCIIEWYILFNNMGMMFKMCCLS